MTVIKFFNSNELEMFLSSSSAEQFEKALPFLSPSEIMDSFMLLQRGNDSKLNLKLKKLFKFINNPDAFKEIGKCLNIASFIGFLDFLCEHPEYKNRLPFLLTGLVPEVFFFSLFFFEESHILLMKDESLFEPVQFQLSLFVREGEKVLHQLNQKIQNLADEFRLISNEELTTELLLNLEQKIKAIQEKIFESLESIRKALSIVWYTNRADLIDKLSRLNEMFHHELSFQIGQPASLNSEPTGIYKILEKKISAVFDESLLKDEDGALEGLTRLSIWHLKDYWEVGLLPSIKRSEDLTPINKGLAHNEWNDTHPLFHILHNELKNLNIETVGDLKKARIFSKSLLKSYIERHKIVSRGNF